MFAAAGAWAAGSERADRISAITVYGGLRDGGSFIDADADRKLRIDGTGAWSIALDRGIDASRQLQFLVSHQRPRLRLGAAAGPATLPMQVTYLHIGGTNFFDGPIGLGPYAVGGLGATLFDPGPGLRRELRPSINLGIGLQVPAGGRFAVRLEARGYFTLVDSSGGLFCADGCVVRIKGDAVTQGDLMLGLSLRF